MFFFSFYPRQEKPISILEKALDNAAFLFWLVSFFFIFLYTLISELDFHVFGVNFEACHQVACQGKKGSRERGDRWLGSRSGSVLIDPTAYIPMKSQNPRNVWTILSYNQSVLHYFHLITSVSQRRANFETIQMAKEANL